MTGEQIQQVQLEIGDKISFNGSDYKVMLLKDLSYMPNQMGFALSRYSKQITFTRITTEIIDYEPANTTEDIIFKGVVQPLKPSELKLKPEDQRAWNWLQVHCFTLKGWMEYHLCQKYSQ